jgi:hypothetical protein
MAAAAELAEGRQGKGAPLGSQPYSAGRNSGMALLRRPSVFFRLFDAAPAGWVGFLGLRCGAKLLPIRPLSDLKCHCNEFFRIHCVVARESTKRTNQSEYPDFSREEHRRFWVPVAELLAEGCLNSSYIAQPKISPVFGPEQRAGRSYRSSEQEKT